MTEAPADLTDRPECLDLVSLHTLEATRGTIGSFRLGPALRSHRVSGGCAWSARRGDLVDGVVDAPEGRRDRSVDEGIVGSTIHSCSRAPSSWTSLREPEGPTRRSMVRAHRRMS